MTKYQKEMLALLSKRYELRSEDFWEAYNIIPQRPKAAENDQKKSKSWDFTHFVYLPFCRQWHGQELKRNYEEAFLDLLEDFLANDSLVNFEDSKLYPKFKEVQDIIAEDIKKRPWKYYKGDIPW